MPRTPASLTSPSPIPSGRIRAAARRKPPAATPASRRSGNPPGLERVHTGSATARPTASAPSGTSRVRRSLTATTPRRATRETSSTATAISLRAPWSPPSPPDGRPPPADRDAGAAGALDPCRRSGATARAAWRHHDRGDVDAAVPEHDDAHPTCGPLFESADRGRREEDSRGGRACLQQERAEVRSLNTRRRPNLASGVLE